MTQVVLDDHTIQLSKEDKVFFPGAGISKGEVVDYYRRVADWMVPLLRDRPLVMHRFPDGIEAPGFIQKDVPDYFPQWIRTVELEKEGGTVTHVVCDDAATLVYLANQACVTPHVLLARASSPRQPEQIIFDLDPPPERLDLVVAAARVLRDVLDERGRPAFVKSSGSKGLHVHVPLQGGDGDFDHAREQARDIAEDVVGHDPGAFTTTQRKDSRGDRLYLDVMRNAYAQHAVAPYAVRALPGAPVAVPLHWDEAVSSDFDPQRFTIKNVFRRLPRKPDPWSDFGAV